MYLPVSVHGISDEPLRLYVAPSSDKSYVLRAGNEPVPGIGLFNVLARSASARYGKSNRRVGFASPCQTR
jgi:hypothetical protein